MCDCANKEQLDRIEADVKAIRTVMDELQDMAAMFAPMVQSNPMLKALFR